MFSFTQISVMQKWVHPTTKTTKSSTLYGLHDFHAHLTHTDKKTYTLNAL